MQTANAGADQKPAKSKKSKNPAGQKKREDTDLMRDLLSKAKATYARSKGDDSCLFTDVGHSKRLEFSNQSLCVYEKHKNLVNDIFLNKNINTFVSYNDKSLNSWNPETMENICVRNFLDAESKNPITPITCLCYSQVKHLYFACSKDFKLYVFNEHLNLVHQERMPVGLVSIINFYDAGRYPQLIVGGKEGCFIIDLDIQFKYDPQMAILLDAKGSSITIKIKSIVQDDALELLEDQSSPVKKRDAFINGLLSGSDGIGDDNQFSATLTNQNDNLPVNYKEKKYGSYIKHLQGVGEWVKGIKLFESQKLIVAWKKEILSGGAQSDEQQRKIGVKTTRDQIIFYSLTSSGLYQQGEVWSRYYDSSIKEDFITDILVFKDQKFFITAHHSGDIHLRKLVELKNIEIDLQESPGKGPGGKDSQTLKSVHIFKGHSRAVSSLAPIKSKNTYFVSSSEDGKVRIWCFEKMIELYCFDITVNSPVINSAMADSIMSVKLINDKIYAMIFKSFIEIGIVNSHLASSYYISTQAIGGLGKCFINNRDREINNPSSIFISFMDNSIVILDPIEQYIKCTIYPPPTPAEVSRVFYCTSIQRIFLLLASRTSDAIQDDDDEGMEKGQPKISNDDPKSGAICVYRIDKETGTLESIKEAKSIKDYEGKSMSQAITCISNCSTEPPQYDCEIPQDLYKYSEPTNPDYEFIQDEDGIVLDQYLVIGLSKGTIIFIKVNNLSHIYARFSIHREAVLQINEIRELGTFLSICRENQLKIWGFSEITGREVIKAKYNLYREVFKIIVSKQQLLLICFTSGDSEMLLWDDPNKQLCKLPLDKSDEHEDKFTCCDVLIQTGLIVTGDKEGLVKIWNSKKQLIREIKFVESINSVAFINTQGDIIVGHSRNLSKVAFNTYRDLPEPVIIDENDNDNRLDVARYSGPIVNEEEFDIFTETKKPVPLDGFLKMINRPEQQQQQQQKVESKCCSHTPVYKSEARQVEEIVPKIAFGEGNSQHMETGRDAKQVQPQPVPVKTKEPVQIKPTPPVDVNRTLQSQDPSSPAPNVLGLQDANQSKSEDSKEIDPVVLAKNQALELERMRKKTVKIPCVPKSYTLMKKRMAEREKEIQMIKNSTRRTMTQQRITNNILQTNTAVASSDFHDIFVSQTQSHGTLQIQFGNLPPQGQQQKGIKSKSSMMRGPKGSKKGGSQISNAQSKLSDSQFNQKISNMQAQLKQMANSANTFSIFDNNSFEPGRIQNHRLNTVYKNAQKEVQGQNLVPFMAFEQQNMKMASKFVKDQDQQMPSTSLGNMPNQSVQTQHKVSLQQNSGQNYVIVSMHDQLQGFPQSQQIDSAMPSKDCMIGSQSGLPRDSYLGDSTYNFKKERQSQEWKQNPVQFKKHNNFTPNQKFTNSMLHQSQESAFKRGQNTGFMQNELETDQSPKRITNQVQKGNSGGIGDGVPQTAQLQYDGSSRDNSPMMTMKDQKSRLQNRQLMETDIKFADEQFGSTLKKEKTAQLQIKVLQKPLESETQDKNNQSQVLNNENGQNLEQTKQQVQSMPEINEISSNQIKNNSNQDDTQVHTTSGDMVKAEQKGSATSQQVITINKDINQKGDIILSDGEHTKTADGEVGQEVVESSRLVMKKIDERQVVVNLTMEPTVGPESDPKGSSPSEVSPLDKSNRLYVMQKVRPIMDGDNGMNTNNPQSYVSSLQGINTIGNIQTKFKANAGVGAHLENELIQRSVAEGGNTNQYDMNSDYDENQKKFETREFSQKIRGTSRQQAHNQFVEHRVQKRASKMKQIQPHVVTNAILKNDYHYKSKKANPVITFKKPFQTAQNFNATTSGPLSSNYFQIKNQVNEEHMNRNVMKNHIGTGGSYNSKHEFGADFNASQEFSNTQKSPFFRARDSSPQGTKFDHPQSQQMAQRSGYKKGSTSGNTHFASKKTTTGVLSMHFDGDYKSSSGSPQPKRLTHENLANALVTSNERITYDLSQNQTTHRKGGLFTSLPQNPGNVIYMKNVVPPGLHMPSKGLFNYQNKGDQIKKPKTAEYCNGRRQKYNSLINNAADQRPGQLGGLESNKNSVPMKGGRYMSKYRQNMNNIQALSEVAHLATGGQQIKLQQI